jgi:MOSC domain-containing protein YiiM
MFSGILESIYVAASAGGPMHAIPEATAIPGTGLEGDRYALKLGTFYKPDPDRELTLIEAEAIEAMSRDYSIDLPAGGARRNLITRGVPLNHLVGQEFTIGDVRIRGIRLCEPCDYLRQITGQPVIKGLLHRGGLRAQILTQGVIHAGDEIKAVAIESSEVQLATR